MGTSSEVEKLQNELNKVNAESEDVKKKIKEMQRKEDKLEQEKEDIKGRLERAKYCGMSRKEYLKAIKGIRIRDEGVVIDVRGSATVYVTCSTADVKFWVCGAFDRSKVALNVEETVDGKVKYRMYHRIPKDKKEIYNKLISIKTKYGNMIENGEIEPHKDVK
ncbi:hypothetical protein FT641_18695 [Bacillus paranthracis]|uniref:hypothetical protein n=1 Tax=Bacillus paranthracis TaxID=2026186 RepID=UPI00187A5E19|nr:hypothetical protein [Bacillus paranthracis]MBE7114406.1 hypothetical protein [Bacillus paranthracis]MBE7154720.1 hypothetical protein [Bacillus paranthracis]